MPSEKIYAEDELLSLLKQGDEQGFGYLYDHYSAALLGIILRIVQRQELAEDLLQEAFLKIYRGIGQYDAARGRLFTWMSHIARNTAIDATRSKDFQQSKKIRELEDNVNPTDGFPLVMPLVDHIGLNKVVSSLNEDQRNVIDLAYFKGYTQEEISRELDIPLGTVKTRIRNALIQLRTILNIS